MVGKDVIIEKVFSDFLVLTLTLLNIDEYLL